MPQKSTRFAVIDQDVIPFEIEEDAEYEITPPESYTGLDIMGQHHELVWAPKTLLPDRYGQSDAENQEIVIRAGLRGMQCLDTLIHEVTHTISSISGVELTELQVHTIGQAWAQVFRANPELLMFVADRLEEEDSREIPKSRELNTK